MWDWYFRHILNGHLDDIKDLTDLNSEAAPLSFRLCKGIYIEPEAISYKKYEEINQHYLEDLEFMLKNKIHVGIATHDKPLVEGAYKLIEKYNVPKHMYEFQMLYGVTPGLRESIVNDGHTMRVYVPFGEKWFGYSTRRLKENPKDGKPYYKGDICKGVEKLQGVRALGQMVTHARTLSTSPHHFCLCVSRYFLWI